LKLTQGKHKNSAIIFEGKMTTINIKREIHTLDTKILQDLGYTLIGGIWSKKVEMPQIRNEIEKLEILKISNIEIVLD
jgi:cell division protein FtsL